MKEFVYLTGWVGFALLATVWNVEPAFKMFNFIVWFTFVVILFTMVVWFGSSEEQHQKMKAGFKTTKPVNETVRAFTIVAVAALMAGYDHLFIAILWVVTTFLGAMLKGLINNEKA